MTEYRDVVGFIRNLCTSFFKSMINIFIFRCTNFERRIIIILPTD